MSSVICWSHTVMDIFFLLILLLLRRRCRRMHRFVFIQIFSSSRKREPTTRNSNSSVNTSVRLWCKTHRQRFTSHICVPYRLVDGNKTQHFALPFPASFRTVPAFKRLFGLFVRSSRKEFQTNVHHTARYTLNNIKIYVSYGIT